MRASPVGPDAPEQLVGPAAQRPRTERDVPAGVSPDPVDHRPQGVRVRGARLGGAPAVHRSPGALRVGGARERRVVAGDGLGAVAVARAPQRRPHRGVVGRAPAGRRPDHREHVLLGAHELLGQRLDQRGDELPRERRERLHHPAGQRGRPGRHRHGQRDRGALGQPGEAQVAADELEVAQDVGAADVEAAVHLGRQVEGADEVVQDVGDRDRLGAVRQPRHGRQHGHALGEVADHLEARRARADHDRRLECGGRDRAGEEHVRHLGPRREVPRRRARRPQPAQVDDTSHAGGRRRGVHGPGGVAVLARGSRAGRGRARGTRPRRRRPRGRRSRAGRRGRRGRRPRGRPIPSRRACAGCGRGRRPRGRRRAAGPPAAPRRSPCPRSPRSAWGHDLRARTPGHPRVGVS